MFNSVTCVDLGVFNEASNVDGQEHSVCLQCPDGTAGDGKECRAVASKPPEFDRMPANKTVNAQDLIALKCRSKPPQIFPTVQDWRKDGKPLLAEDIANGRIFSSTSQLLIKSATREDSGNYTCTLVNSAGNITSNRSEVIVRAAPRILGVLSADVSRDGNANLSCIVSCYPPSNITWKFKGKNLTRSARYEFIDSSYMLKVKNVQFVDAGLYECSLINELGEARANASLTVGLTVEFVDYPRDSVFNEGDQVTLNCNVTGVPRPQIAWKKEGELVMNGIKHTVTTYAASSRGYTASQLQIRQVTKEDVAVYSCVAWNRGSIRVWQATVLVTGPPIISTPPKDASVLSGANVTFFCLGLGAPEPKMRWLKDSETVQSSKRVVIDTEIGSLRLFVVTVADAGKYTCVYKNRLGEDRRSAVLRVDGIDPGQLTPAPPLARTKSISTGTIVAIVVILVAIIAIIVGIVLYRYCHERNETFQFAVDGNSLRPSLRSRFKNAMGKNQPSSLYYNHSRDEVNFDDSKPFVDHDEL